jgi:hypothetical protein
MDRLHLPERPARPLMRPRAINGYPRPDPPRAPAREGQSPLPPQPLAGSPRPNPSPKRRKPGSPGPARVPGPICRGRGTGGGFPLTGGLGSHRRRGGTRTEANPAIVQTTQRVRRNFTCVPLKGQRRSSAAQPSRSGGLCPFRGRGNPTETPPKWGRKSPDRGP